MADASVSINGVFYPLSRGKNGERKWSITARPSLPTDPSLPVQVTEWQVWGPNLISFEVIDPGQTQGYLGVDYGTDTDSRWDGLNTLGPQVSTTDLSGTSGTKASPVAFALSTTTMNSNGARLYVTRGNHLAKIKPSDMSRAVEASANLGANATDLLYTRAAGGTEEIAVAEGDANNYQVLTTVANDGSNDTYASPAAAKFTKFLSSGLGTNNRIFGAQGATSTTPAQLYGNILTGAVTMGSPSWNQIATLAGDNVTIGSMGLDGNFLAIGTNGGVYMIDPDFSKFRPIDPETPIDSNNGQAMGSWMPIGLLFSLARSLRFVKNGQGTSVGPENFMRNTSPVRGRVTAISGSDRWLYLWVYDEIAGNTTLMAARPRQTGDPHPNALSLYTLRTFSSTRCDAAFNMGTVNGVRTLPTIVFGYHTSSVDDIGYFGEGRTVRWPDDTSYTYATSGTTYLTESRRQPGIIKDVEAVEFESAGCDASKTITFGISFDGAAAVTLAAVTTNGYQRLLPTSGGVPLAASTWSGRRIKPQFAFSSNSTSSVPSVVGTVRVHWRGRPIQTKVLQFSVDLLSANAERNHSGKSVAEQEAQLLTEWGSGPVSIEDIETTTAYYVRVTNVAITEVQDTGSDQTRSAGAIRQAAITAILWPTASGQ